jgi:hypothetical protein
LSQFGNICIKRIKWGKQEMRLMTGRNMANGNNTSDGREPKFNFGTRELREAQRAKSLELEQPARKQKDDGGGFDPYNTSGSFDRKKHWERVGKR